MRSARFEPLNLELEVVDQPEQSGALLVPGPLLVRDVPLDVLQPTFEGACIGLAQSHGPERADHNNNSHTQQVANHTASLPPDLAERLTRDRYNEDQGATEREVGYRKGWNDHARYMLRMFAAREAL
jgi:hypothetical protein